MNENEIELTDTETSALRALRVEQSAPDGLRRSLVSELRHRDLLRPRWYQSGLSMVATGAAAAILLAVLGVVAGMWLQSRGSTAVAGNGQPAFMLLLRSTDKSLTGNESERVLEYGRWAGELLRNGQFVDAGRLAETSRLLGMEDRAATNITPVSGYFIIRAADLDHAVDIARNCPHIAYGGELEVRPIDLRRNQ